VTYIHAFIILQFLDFVTTIVGFRLGGVEASPFVRWLTEMGPVTGIALAKLLAFLLAGVCLWFRKERVILWVNYFFAVLVLWNVGQLVKVLV
jgi:hypothetical protein